MLEGMKPPTRKFPCKVLDIKLTLELSDQIIFEQAIMDKAWAVRTLEKELRARGIQISDSTIERHRGKLCSCWTD